jgi:hypothetical protein
MSNFRFSGHETFHCKSFWIKKGYDYLESNLDFKSDRAVIDLGVGKNMVASINYWTNAFDIQNLGSITEWSKLIFSNSGFDPYIEKIGTIWLLHFHLLQKDYSSINNITFNNFRKTRIGNEFTDDNLNDFLVRFCIRNSVSVSSNSLKSDVKVFLRNYVNTGKFNPKSIEDDVTTLLTELNLIKEIDGVYQNNKQVLKFNYNDKESLPALILLYAIILRFPNSTSISILDIQNEVSESFLCNREGTESKLNELQDLGLLIKKEDAGRYEIQIKTELNSFEILKMYYV